MAAWGVLALESDDDTMSPLLKGISGDYGHKTTSWQIGRRGDDRDSITLGETPRSIVYNMPVSFTRDGVTYPMLLGHNSTTFRIVVQTKEFLVRVFYYCTGPSPTLPPNASSLSCPSRRSQKEPCYFTCNASAPLTDPDLFAGSIACTRTRDYQDASCALTTGVTGTAPARASATPTPADSAVTTGLACLAAEPTPMAPNASTPTPLSRAIPAAVVLLCAIALWLLLTRRSRAARA